VRSAGLFFFEDDDDEEEFEDDDEDVEGRVASPSASTSEVDTSFAGSYTRYQSKRVEEDREGWIIVDRGKVALVDEAVRSDDNDGAETSDPFVFNEELE